MLHKIEGKDSYLVDLNHSLKAKLSNYFGKEVEKMEFHIEPIDYDGDTLISISILLTPVICISTKIFVSDNREAISEALDDALSPFQNYFSVGRTQEIIKCYGEIYFEGDEVRGFNGHNKA